ncbi:hypothetical protein WQ54_20680 [Bacillus sp. SA1-12]|uniref:hypothetical protein n=1 Tax=Bacillus sp. SA1-12 TaxID=1455638 RepID=UPI00062726F4|nr:hypothetical protein [Bacillus sp. SA1-12]KKI90381.1 hypothetical protein WQ54_20680 [Bacillus sp. SA1-12]
MNQENLLAEELLKMINEDKVPLSISDDIHEISRSLQSGDMNINDLQGKDAFIENTVQEAMNRINNNNH